MRVWRKIVENQLSDLSHINLNVSVHWKLTHFMVKRLRTRLYNKFIDSEIYEIINVIIITIIRNDWWWWWWWVATVVVVAVVLRFDQIVAIHLPSNHGLTWICLFGLRFSINSCRNEKPRICIYLDIHKI